MARAYGVDLRERVLGAAEEGVSVRRAAARFEVGISTAIVWVRRFQETGETVARKQGKPRGCKLDLHEAFLLGLIKAQPDVTLEEMREALLRNHGLAASLATIWRFFESRGITFKKTAHAQEQEREDVAEARRKWREMQPQLDPKRLVFIDESGFTTKMARLRGRSARGERLIASIPHGHWKTLTFIAGLRHDRIVAPMVLDGPMDGAAFLAYVEKFLAPALSPGDIVMADNLSSHKVAGARELIEAAGAEFWLLPPYSPDLNPIEQAFSKFKALTRKAAERTIDGLCRTIGHALKKFTPKECSNFLANAGYAPV